MTTTSKLEQDRAIDLGAWIDRAWDSIQKPTRAMAPVLTAPSHVLDVHGVGALGYYADLSCEGRPIVLLHGVDAAAGSHEIEPLFERFRTERPTYALDLPGFGLSARDDRDYSPQLFARAIGRFLRDVVDPAGGADLVTLSLTSELAARSLVVHPELARSVAMLAPTGLGRTRGIDLARARSIERALRSPLIGRPLFAALSSRPSIRYYLQKTMMAPAPDALIDAAYESAHVMGAHHAPLAFVSGSLFHPHARDELYARLRIPTLVLCDADSYVGLEEAPDLARENPRVRVQTITGSRFMPYDQPDVTADALRAFHASLEPTPTVSRPGARAPRH